MNRFSKTQLEHLSFHPLGLLSLSLFIKINVFIVNLFNKNTFLINLLVGSLN